MFGFFLIGFISLTIAHIINYWTNSEYIGFLAISLLYFVFLLVFVSLVKSGYLKRKLEEALIEGMGDSEAIESEDDKDHEE